VIRQASSPPVLLGRVLSPWLIPLISGARTSSFASLGERSRETPIYQGNRCYPYNGVEVSGQLSNQSIREVLHVLWSMTRPSADP
jgi:hypothetical protein